MEAETHMALVVLKGGRIQAAAQYLFACPRSLSDLRWEQGIVFALNLKRAGRLDRLLKFRFADQFVKKLKRKMPSIGPGALPELVVSGWCVSERLVWVWQG